MICTFYSYKGGVGRSMALANVAELLYQAGYKVLVVDWDLEAPGLERFFFGTNQSILDNAGIIDLLQGYMNAISPSLHKNETLHIPNPDEYVINVHVDDPSSNAGQLKLLTAGCRSSENFAKYSDRVLTFNWKDFYRNWEGERYFEWLRSQFETMADITLIDSRTGVTEMGGVCTYQLADVVVMLCAPNNQNFEGTLNIAQNLTSMRLQELRAERPLRLMIVPARIEKAESDRLNKFQEQFLNQFRHFASPNEGFSIEQFWQLAIPYVPRYAYSEEIAVHDGEKAAANEIVAAFHKLKQKIEHLRLYQIAEQEPTALPRELTSALARINLQANQLELIELSRLAEKFAEKYSALENVLLFSRGMVDFSLGNYKDAEIQFIKVFGANQSEIVIHDIKINKPQRVLWGVGIFEYIGQQLLNDYENLNQQRKFDKQQWLQFDWNNAAQAYFDKLFKLYDRVRILGNSVDVPLGNIFTQVYILDKPTARQRYSINELRKQGQDRLSFQHQPWRRTLGLDLVRTNQNLFILGKPGAGKTTFLRYITIQAVRQQLPRIPIFVSLNQWADSRWGRGDNAALLPFLAEQFDICDFPDAALFIDYLLQAGQALVLFDGLDEVKQEKDQRRRLTRLLQDFARKYDKSQCLITCRIAASDYTFADFTDVEVADFTPDQVREYTRNWFGSHERKFDAFTVELAKPENQGLSELCNTPLLLSLLCLTFDNTMRFPPSRIELYEDALETLLRKWDSSRQIQRDEIYRELSHKRKLQLLMSIATSTFSKGELFFRQRDLERWIVDYLTKLPSIQSSDILDGTSILKAMEAQHSILVERAQGVYSFSHLTFQEYLTARYLAENQGKGMINELIRSHWTDRRWREVFLMTASLLDDADEFMAALQQTTNEIVTEVSPLRGLLVWAHGRAQQASSSIERQTTIQMAYIFLSLALSLASDLAHTIALSLASDLARTLAHTLDLVRTLDLSLARTLERALDLALALARDHDHDLNRGRDLDSIRMAPPLVGFDYGLFYIWVYATLFADERLERTDNVWQATMQTLPNLMQDVARLASEGGISDLAQLLVSIPIPSPNSTPQAWHQYAAALFSILRNQRNLEYEWNFTDKEIEKLSTYFYANEFLVQCLKVVTVSDRQAVLDKLLVLPNGLLGKGVV